MQNPKRFDSYSTVFTLHGWMTIRRLEKNRNLIHLVNYFTYYSIVQNVQWHKFCSIHLTAERSTAITGFALDCFVHSLCECLISKGKYCSTIIWSTQIQRKSVTFDALSLCGPVQHNSPLHLIVRDKCMSELEEAELRIIFLSFSAGLASHKTKKETDFLS